MVPLNVAAVGQVAQARQAAMTQVLAQSVAAAARTGDPQAAVLQQVGHEISGCFMVFPWFSMVFLRCSMEFPWIFPF